MDNMYNTKITDDELQKELQRAERRARRFQSQADRWCSACKKAEQRLAEIGQEARNHGLIEGLGYGILLGASAVYAEAFIWRRIFRK